MTLLPKPPRRGPKPRKPLPRNRQPIRRRVRPAPYRKGKAAAAKRDLQREWSLMVRQRAIGGLCARCLCCKATDAAHCFPKGAYPNVRLDTTNGAPLCRLCHRDFHKHPTVALHWFRLYLGEHRFSALEARALRPADLAPAELRESREAAKEE